MKLYFHREDPTLDRLCGHFYALEVMGPDHVGIGSDLSGTPRALRPIPKDVSMLEDLFVALAKRGLDEGTMIKIAGENLLRMLPD